MARYATSNDTARRVGFSAANKEPVVSPAANFVRGTYVVGNLVAAVAESDGVDRDILES